MALYEKRIEARYKRACGISIKDIAQTLNVSKSTVSIWCRDIQLSNQQKAVLMAKYEDRRLKGRLIGAEVNRKKRIDAIALAYDMSLKTVGEIQKRELILIAAALFWAEGSKSQSTSGFQFINSDPDMILCIKKALVHFGINNNDLFCTIQINQIHKPRIQTVLKFWKNLLKFSDGQFRQVSFVSTIPRKVYENYDNYYGICRLQVRKSTFLKYQMLGLIEALKKDILSPR